MVVLSILLACAIVALGYVFTFVGRREKSLPDGPPTLPIVGNLHQIPIQRGYLKFAEWAKTYGGMYSIKLASKTAIVISDRRLVKQLMDKRSDVSSDRPPVHAIDMIWEGAYLLLQPASDLRWRLGRKLIHQYFKASMVETQHIQVVNAEAVQMLRDICVSPANLSDHPKRFANSLIMSIAYGIRTPTANIAHMVKVNYALERLTLLLQPGSTPPMDIFAFTRWIPQQLWGNWVNKVEELKVTLNDLYSEYFDMTVKRRREKGSRDTFTDKLIDSQAELAWDRRHMYIAAGGMMEAGSDTTSSVIETFLHLMARFPDVAKMAQKEIDSVVGEERTPVWNDFAQLPTINAIIKECFRYRTIAPIAFPHALSDDVVIDGKVLPKGSTIILNITGLHNDSAKFEHPETFDPVHFAGKTALASDYANAADYEARDHYGYGTGRRICPGIHLAERSIWISAAKILWAFDIGPRKDELGNTVELDISYETGYEDGVITKPLPWRCDIQPRSERRRETIMREFAEAERDVFSKYEVPTE